MNHREINEEQDSKSKAETMPLFLMKESNLGAGKRSLQAGEEALRPAFSHLLAEADELLSGPIISIVNKSVIPPGGNKHDYYSAGPYWWPNPRTESGLPYIRRDGLINPETTRYDQLSLKKFWHSVEKLALAYFYTDQEQYAVQAIRLLRGWFIDEATRMNPHLEFGQAIPGICQGRGIGIIESHIFAYILDAASLLQYSPFWTPEDRRGLTKWFEAFTVWLLDSSHGKEEAGESNNHGTYYDVQVILFALFSGMPEKAENWFRSRVLARMNAQIRADGLQPHEAARTLGLGYSLFSLNGFFILARLGERFGISLWDIELPGGGSLRKATDFLIPFLSGAEEWPYQQIKPLEQGAAFQILRKATLAYGGEQYEQVALQLDQPGFRQSRVQLLWPYII